MAAQRALAAAMPLCIVLLVALIATADSFSTSRTRMKHAKVVLVPDPFRPPHLMPNARRRKGASALDLAPPVADVVAVVPSALSAINSFLQSNPMLAAFLTGSAQASFADVLAQTRERLANDDQKFAPLRTLSFLLFGGLYQGMFNENMFNRVMPVWFGAGTCAWTVLKKVAFAMLVLGPVCSLPTAYSIKAVIFRRSLGEGIRRYLHDVFENGLLIKFWGLWTPVNAINFSLVPPHLRVPVNSAVCLFWMTVLSTISARQDRARATREEGRRLVTA